MKKPDTAAALEKFLPSVRNMRLAQAKISSELHEAVRQQIIKDKANHIPIDWTVLIEAACKAYLSTRKAKIP